MTKKDEEVQSLIKKYGTKKVKAASSKENMERWWLIVRHPGVCRACRKKVYEGLIYSFEAFCPKCQQVVAKILER